MGLRKGGRLLGSGLCLLVGTWCLSQALEPTFWIAGGEPIDDFVRTWLGSLLVAVSLGLLALALREGTENGGADGDARKGSLAKPLWESLALVAYAFLFPLLGYLVAGGALVGGLMLTLGPTRSHHSSATLAAMVGALAATGMEMPARNHPIAQAAGLDTVHLQRMATCSAALGAAGNEDADAGKRPGS